MFVNISHAFTEEDNLSLELNKRISEHLTSVPDQIFYSMIIPSELLEAHNKLASAKTKSTPQDNHENKVNLIRNEMETFVIKRSLDELNLDEKNALLAILKDNDKNKQHFVIKLLFNSCYKEKDFSMKILGLFQKVINAELQ